MPRLTDEGQVVRSGSHQDGADDEDERCGLNRESTSANLHGGPGSQCTKERSCEEA